MNALNKIILRGTYNVRRNSINGGFEIRFGIVTRLKSKIYRIRPDLYFEKLTVNTRVF